MNRPDASSQQMEGQGGSGSAAALPDLPYGEAGTTVNDQKTEDRESRLLRKALRIETAPVASIVPCYWNCPGRVN